MNILTDKECKVLATMLAEKDFQRNRLAIYLIEKQGTIYVQASQFDNLKEEVKSIYDLQRVIQDGATYTELGATGNRYMDWVFDTKIVSGESRGSLGSITYKLVFDSKRLEITYHRGNEDSSG